ncbi:hypothetical protein B0H11DRAFT_2128452 [Mycena galericulata]|nr:hypothetical protein B0H11DRAFT_2128452 [Mycena galericulata]
MLKRLRPASPPASIPSIPLVLDPSDSHRHESKRRRILPPSLDGQSRRSTFRTNDDGEDDDDDDEMNLSDASNPPGCVSAVHNSEYESANNFLHELHASHRHRLIFSPSWQPPLHPESLSALQYQDKVYVERILDYPRLADEKDSSGTQDFGSGLPFEEVQSVKERYEDTNKLLGSLFLTRRKQLDQPQNST